MCWEGWSDCLKGILKRFPHLSCSCVGKKTAVVRITLGPDDSQEPTQAKGSQQGKSMKAQVLSSPPFLPEEPHWESDSKTEERLAEHQLPLLQGNYGRVV